MVDPTSDSTPTRDLLGASNLTRSQHLMWMGHKLDPTAPLYNMAVRFDVDGPVDADAFGRAFEALVAGSDTMRTVVTERDGVPRQVVLASMPDRLERVDLSAATDPDAACAAWVGARCRRPFRLETCLYDAALIRRGDDRFTWYLNQHHLATDAWSTSLVCKRISALYGLALDGRLHDAPNLPQYADYVAHERARIGSPAVAAAVAYWHAKQSTRFEPLPFYGEPRPERGSRTTRVPYALGAERTAAIESLCRRRGFGALTTELARFNVFCTALFAWLHRISNRDAIAIGAPSHNRGTAAFKETIGLFIEIFPLHAQIDPDETFASLHAKVVRESFGFLLNAQPGVSEASHSRDCDVILNFIHASFAPLGGLPTRSDWLHPGAGDRVHSLRLQVHDLDDAGQILLQFDFNEDVFEPAHRQWAIDHFVRVLDGLVADPEQPISAVGLLSPAEAKRLVVDGNVTAAEHPKDRTVIDLFDAQAASTPDAVAVAIGEATVTYAELARRADAVAAHLAGRRIGRGQHVGVCLGRSVEMLVAVLGAMKSGAAYVPLDPALPPSRLAHMADDAALAAVLTVEMFADCVPAPVVRLDSLAELRLEPASAPTPPRPDDVAYVIYTSGSTGRPKGVLVEHSGLRNYLWWARRQYAGDRAVDLPLFSSFSFDLTVTSLFLPLLCGGRVVVYPEAANGPDLAILDAIDDDRVDVLKATPSHLALIRHRALRDRRLKTLIVGGEDLRRDFAKSIHNVFDGDIAIYNEYGPTETVVGCAIHRFDPAVDTGASVPIGRPTDNARLYLLDRQRNPVPDGVEGEIYIGGEGVARGYLNRPELTEGRFVPDPFAGGRMYRTGDLARRLPAGDLVYLRRIDGQVKIRGVRVELGEVEAALAAHGGVREVVVDVVERNRSSMVSATECVRCGLPSTHPDGQMDGDGVCRMCRMYDAHRAEADAWFRPMDDLRAIAGRAKDTATGDYDCLHLLSGGKDSTYVVYQLVRMGLRVLTLTLDNGYISEGAMANIRRVTEALGVDHLAMKTPAMPAIFADSLQRFSNVCNGCFKTIYTMAMNVARQRGIRYVITGLSRGQIFETRLQDLFRAGIFDPDEVDRTIVAARRAYHRADDAVSRHLDVRMFRTDRYFDEITFVDFYRYCDVELGEMMRFLSEHSPWLRPPDTGRSTNCLINELGIYVHKAERGFHNYAAPYAWDVRLGHKTREAALDELDDDINEPAVRRILGEIGYQVAAPDETAAERRLVAWYVPSGDRLSASELRAYAARVLPDYMVPGDFVPLDSIPLGPSGKADRRALPAPEAGHTARAERHVAPRNPTEARLAQIWTELLGVPDVGVHDDFFALGGDSIVNIQTVARARHSGLLLTPKQVFDHPTIAELAGICGQVQIVAAEQGRVSGPMTPTPIQRWFLDRVLPTRNHFAQALWLRIDGPVDPAHLRGALAALADHHDALRTRLAPTSAGWKLTIEAECEPPPLDRFDSAAEAEAVHAKLDLRRGPSWRAALVDGDAPRLLLTAHHLVVDGLSWWILAEDLETAYGQLAAGEPLALPPKTTSFKRWSETLTAFAQSGALDDERAYWLEAPLGDPAGLPADARTPSAGGLDSPDIQGDARTVRVSLDADETRRLLHDAPSAYNTRVDDLLLTALAQTFAAHTGRGAVLIDVEGHGREALVDSLDLLRTVGWFTSLFPVWLEADAGDPGPAIRRVKEQLRRVPRRGVGYGILRYGRPGSDVARQLADRPRAGLLYNYLGQIDAADRASRWRADGPIFVSRAADTPRAHAVELNAHVAGGRLHADWTYGPSRYAPETIGGFAIAWRDRLGALIDHCAGQEEVRPTVSDFPLAGLDDRKLGQLVALLGENELGENELGEDELGEDEPGEDGDP